MSFYFLAEKMFGKGILNSFQGELNEKLNLAFQSPKSETQGRIIAICGNIIAKIMNVIAKQSKLANKTKNNSQLRAINSHNPKDNSQNCENFSQRLKMDIQKSR